MTHLFRVLVIALASITLIAGCGGGGDAEGASDGGSTAGNDASPSPDSSGSAYDAHVLSAVPAVYLPMAPTDKGTEPDRGRSRLTGTYHAGGTPLAITSMPNGDNAVVFNGRDQYLEFPDVDELSVTTTGILSIEAWLRPDTNTFPKTEGGGHVHWMGKGEISGTSEDEWAARIYSIPNDEDRANRISGYVFNPEGGLGAGSFFQDPVTPGQWIHYVFVINTRETPAAHPTGVTKLYKNGVLRDVDYLDEYGIRPRNGRAPFRVGTRAGRSFFLGAIGKVAVYGREISAEEALSHYRAMCTRGC